MLLSTRSSQQINNGGRAFKKSTRLVHGVMRERQQVKQGRHGRHHRDLSFSWPRMDSRLRLSPLSQFEFL